MRNLIYILAAFCIIGCQEHKKEIIYKTIYVYRDTCDSEFIRKIGEIESLNTDNAIGDGGRAIGRYGIHDICVKGSGLQDLLNYNHKDMADSVKAEHVFWAVMGINCHTYAMRHGKYPRYEDLARMWNGGPAGYKMNATLKYLEKFREL
jgi:hypothetical protein